MTLFSFLWTPLFYLFWRSMNDKSSLGGGTWALFIGMVVAFLRFFLGSFINPEGFGLARWISACVDVVALPVVLPFVICILFAALRIISFQANFANYAFLWLIPVAAFHALTWSSQHNPLLLMGVPVLWTAVALGMGLLIGIIQGGWSWKVIPAILGTIALPLAAATSYWALYIQQDNLGLFLLGLCLVPTAISIVLSFMKTIKKKD